MIGPLLGSAAAGYGESAPGFLAAGLCLANFAFAWKLLPESIGGREEAEAERRDDAAGAAPRHRPSQRQAIVRVLAHPASARSRLVWIYALGMMAFMAMNGVIVLYLDRVFEVSEQQIGWFYTYVGGVSLLMRALLLGPINRRLGDVMTMRAGALALGLGLALTPWAGGFVSLAVIILLIPIGTALLFPATTSLVSRLSARRETGQNLGVQQGFGGVARMLGPIWSTAVFQHVGLAAPFWMAGGLMAVVVLISLGVHPAPRTGREAAAAEAVAPVEPS
jgi:predicted MFS family arabinose efflux permease